MDIDKFGILLTIVIVGSVLSIGGITSGEYGFSSLEIPDLVNVPNSPLNEPVEEIEYNPYYEWCYKMKLENCG
tara:strand:- start:48 stop:266 length:219 start_codon:yes stop_codon:yes gene_type:complete